MQKVSLMLIGSVTTSDLSQIGSNFFFFEMTDSILFHFQKDGICAYVFIFPMVLLSNVFGFPPVPQSEAENTL